ncbi:hypothetical protein ACFLYA_00385 [Candidatus Dependentiae bacterium]
MNMFYRKKRFYIRAISLSLFLSLNVSLFLSAEVSQNASPCVSAHDALAISAEKNITDSSLQEKLDLLRVDYILDSTPFLLGEHVIIDDNEWEELEIENILENWKKYTKTKLDLWGIKKLLKHAPQGSKELIRLLVEDDQAFETLDQIIDCAKDSQDALLAYWQEGNLFHYDAQKLYYSIFKRFIPKVNKFLNSNAATLEASQVLGVAKPFFNILAGLGVIGLVGGFFTAKLFKAPFNWKKSFIDGIKKPIWSHDPRPVVFKDEIDFAALNHQGMFQLKIFDFLNRGTLGDKFIVDKHLLKIFMSKLSDNEKIKNVSAATIAVLFEGSMLAWSDYTQITGFRDSVNKIIFSYKTSIKLQNDLVKVADLLRSLEDLEQLYTDAFAIDNIQEFLKKEGVSEDLARLLDLLHSPTFASKASFFFSRGRVLNTHRLFSEIKDEITPLLQNIALLGGYRAIAQMVREHKNKRVKFCFVEYAPNGPIVRMKNAWLPLIDENEVVTNDIHLGLENGPVNAVVTGPNGGGKSCFMITVALGILLARLGIVAADWAYISDFEKIRTSLHPVQDLKSGLSAFMAEHKRVDEVKRAIDSCGGNILVLLDEPYKGTVEVESAKRVYQFGLDIAAIPNCMLLLATHLRKPIELQEGTDGIFANFQMGYIEYETGSFKRTFKVLDGPAIWWFDDADMRSRFVDWLCTIEI